MKISEQGLALITEFEGFRSSPYADSAGIATIGIGTTIYNDGTKVTLNDTDITQEQAQGYLEYHLSKRVYPVLDGLELSQNQFDALCSFIYNEGAGNWGISNLKTLVTANAVDPKIKDEFSRWVYCNHKVLPGLIKRREAEAGLYFG